MKFRSIQNVPSNFQFNFIHCVAGPYLLHSDEPRNNVQITFTDICYVLAAIMSSYSRGTRLESRQIDRLS